MRYALRRILLIFPTLFIVTLILAGMIRILPGDVIDIMTQGSIRGESKEFAKVRLGLDKSFPEQYISWIVGWPVKEGKVYRTADGGDSWGKIGAETIEPLEKVSFITPTQGWAIGQEVIFGTTDGGRIWINQHKEDDALRALTFVDAKEGWAVGDGGTILHTTEGGLRRLEADVTFTTWLPQESSTGKRLNDVAFVDSYRGWVVGEGGTILHTTDGGDTWVGQRSPVGESFSAISFANERSGVAVGQRGTILYTQDGGLSWSKVDTGLKQDLTDVVFTDEFRGLAIGKRGTLLQTADGGLTWQPRSIAVVDQAGKAKIIDKSLSAVTFGDSRTGAIVGESGIVLLTQDGGASWSQDPIELVSRDGDGITEVSRVPIKSASLVVGSTGAARLWVATADTHWEMGVIGGNMGESFRDRVPVAGEIGHRFAPSFQLMIMSMLFALLFSIPIGIISAIRQDTIGDYAGRIVAIIGLAIPTFWVGALILVLPSIWWGWAPPLKYVSFFDGPVENLKYFAIPALVAGLPRMASVMRMTRAMMLEVYRQDYIRTAWSKGLRERVVVIRHGLRNAMIPVITIIGLQIPFQLGEQVIVEQIFGVPGIGRLALESLETRDFPLILGVNLFLGAVIVMSNVIVDLAYSWVDPRIRYD